MDELIEMKAVGKDQRAAVLAMALPKFGVNFLSDVKMQTMAQLTEYFTMRELFMLCSLFAELEYTQGEKAFEEVKEAALKIKQKFYGG
mmetsp:Transcript_13306/g.20798  ORF Transcript_13306/g.20798 Transcript_13306/m.20798 type:complete len:88 (+) Transcript_13306:2191-2454(+)